MADLTITEARVVSIVPIEDLDLLREIEDRLDLEEAARVREEIARKGTIPWATVKAE